AGQRGGVGHVVPQLERPLEQGGGLAVGVQLVGGGRGLDRGGKRGRLVARGGVVVGDAGGDECVGRALLERTGELEVQLGLLAGQQVGFDDLAQQRVAEGVAALLVGDDDV